ncbi:hypothetical protein [Streptomyces sp. NPDC056982]|uniref:hypothetical protein n=1 Tax=Streptomyces sp. NPDC056982 TaxID=3345986 RepID=UPI00364448DF
MHRRVGVQRRSAPRAGEPRRAGIRLVAESDEGEVVRHTFCRVERREASVITLPAAVVSMEQPAVDPAGAWSRA